MKELNFKIRKAKGKDYFAVNSLFRESYARDQKNLPDTYSKIPRVVIDLETYSHTLNDKDFQIFVAEISGLVTGVIEISVEKASADCMIKPFTRVAVEELSVSKYYIGRGTEKALLDKAKNWAIKHKINELTFMVYGYNKDLINICKDNNFEPYSIRFKHKTADK